MPHPDTCHRRHHRGRRGARHRLAGYGPTIAIGKSITISGDGATIFAGEIVINNASAVVTLRGLVLNGGGSPSGADGVTITAAKTVHIERCTIHGFPLYGIEIDINSNSNSDVFVTDSTVRDNASRGLVVSDAAAARLTVENSHFDANGVNGLAIFSGEAVIDRSSASGNGNDGILLSAARATVTSTVAAHDHFGIFLESGSGLTLESSVLRGNVTGLFAFSGSTARISNSVVTQNTTGIANGGTMLTRQNNTVSGNTTNNLTGNALTPLGGI